MITNMYFKHKKYLVPRKVKSFNVDIFFDKYLPRCFGKGFSEDEIVNFIFECLILNKAKVPMVYGVPVFPDLKFYAKLIYLSYQFKQKKDC